MCVGNLSCICATNMYMVHGTQNLDCTCKNVNKTNKLYLVSYKLTC